MKKIALIISILFIQINVFSQSLLWEISGNGLENPSYLYGTIHIQDKRVFAFDSVVTNAFNSCDAFAMEILMSEVKPETMQKVILMKDNSLDKLMSAEDYKLLSDVFKEKMGTSIMLYNIMKPFFLSSQIQVANMPKDMDEALDMHLLKKAIKDGKATYGVEKFEDQINAVDKISLEDQVKMLLDVVKDTTKSNDEFEELIKTYLSMDIEAMQKQIQEEESLPKEFEKIFLTDRNKVMAKSIKKLSKKHSIFVAVGAAHLPSEEGVIQLLKNYGYTVKPIDFKFVY